jgi:dethiobiotin synthetase
VALNRPDRLVAVLGTATEVGKTWVGCRLADELRAAGVAVAARKPAQSWDPAERAAGAPTDAELLAAATGAEPDEVCPPHRSYPVALAPPMAADRLGRPAVHLAELVEELRWPPGVEVGLVEGAGGVRSPLAHDADGVALARHLGVDLVVLVADAGLGTIHAVRAATDALRPLPTVVLLNRYDPGDELHVANRAWLTERDGLLVEVDVAGLVVAVRPPSDGR